ncbi:DNA-directed RNA polymerase [Escherichia phage UAB_Phi78]|uniref:DNA-directed RNA polymerase n=1 Tax=Escherichia phage UAB_Phi78 TaxID=979726 RepID=A0A9K0IFS8_9CAUD|nr:RNA polymerase [Escherichia phage UAB_Phi78]ADW95214.1 DNA-directed RNA polymerase [Escherichia phage UAB_Phi78]
MQDLHAIQLQLEEEMFNGGIRRFEADQQRQIAAGSESDTAWNRRLLSELIAPMAEGIQAYKEEYEGKKGRAPRALAFLQCVENEVAAYITMKVVMDMLNTDVTLQAIAMSVAERIEDQVRFSKLEGHAAKYFEKVKKSLKASRTKSYRHAHNVAVVAEKSVAEKDADFDRWEAWPKEAQLQIGTTLLEILEGSVFYNGEPVFMRAMRTYGGKTIYYLQTSESVGQWISAFKEHVAQLSPAYAPCVVPPRPWKTPFNGGFHTEKVASRIRLVKGNREHVRKLTQKQMPKVYKAINALQNTQWQINKDVLAVIEEVIRLDLGYGVPSFKPLIDKENKPANPVPVEFQHLRGRELKEMLSPEQWQQFINWKGECARLYTAETKRGSKSAAVVRMVGQARKYSTFESIYFVYAMDSRSRVYAQSSTLSPQSNDLGKALLRFTEGRPVDSVEALKWFCVNGANLWGWDKKIFDVRVSNVLDEEFQDMCRDIAADPLTFTQWAKADAPYEFLAWCFEYAQYLDLVEEGRADEFRTHLPVHQDGSCSGIQHYSAMLRDEVGAKAVNLKPSDTPQDIYGAVAQVVIKKNALYMDADDATTFTSGSVTLSGAELRAMASAWDSIGITRSLTKKPVMTLPYGSTRLTCRESVIDYIVDLEEKEAQKAVAEGRTANKVHPFEDDRQDYLTPGAAYNYMTALIWPSISEVVKAPIVAMKMIRQLARFAAKRNEGLMYTLPTGFILEQKIMATEMLRVRTCLMGDIKMSLQVETDIVDEAAMMGAAAPNFVHGHDASHLILTVCELVDKGVTSIAVIHDSFGTHADNTLTLRVALKGQMVAMYSEGHALQKLLDEHEDRWMVDTGIEVPEQGEFDLNEIMESEYVFA